MVQAVPDPSRRALAIGDDLAAPGFVGARLEQRGVELVTITRGGDVLLPDLDGFDLVLPLGSIWSVYDPAHAWWMDTELALLRKAADTGVPVLGICFGAQGLAAALGGEVRRAEWPEIGWLTIESDDPEVIPPGPWMEWHSDTFTLPPGAVELARSPVGPQAYRVGRNLAVQFHPEVTGEILEVWLTEGHGELSRENIDAEALRADAGRYLDGARAGCNTLVDHFLAVAFADPPGSGVGNVR